MKKQDIKIAMFEVQHYEEEFVESYKGQDFLTLTSTKQALSEDTIGHAKGVDGVSVLNRTLLNAQLLNMLKDVGVKHISVRTVGFDNIDLPYAKKLGFSVSHLRYPSHNVADYTVMLILMALRKASETMLNINAGNFAQEIGLRGFEMRSLSVGIIGAGKIGRAVIDRLIGFGCSILVYDEYKDAAIEKVAKYVSLDEIYAKSDIISLLVPLNEHTMHLINTVAIAKMRKSPILVNTARGGVVDTAALLDALDTGRISYAALDVIEDEHLILRPTHGQTVDKNSLLMRTINHKKVLFTPHIAFFTREVCSAMVDAGINSIVLEMGGEQNPNRVLVK